MPSLSTPEQIEAYGKKQPRPLLLDANVVAYFADIMSRIGPPVRSCADRRTSAPASNREAPASAQSRS